MILTAAIFTLSLYSTPVFASISNSAFSESSNCISFDSSESNINNLQNFNSYRYLQSINKNILDKETSDGVWLLNAGIVIEHDAKLVINEGDTK